MSPASRRGILGASVALLATGGAVAPAIGATHPDAELIARCAEFHEFQAILDAWDADLVEEDAGEAAQTEWWARFEAIVATQARTFAGIKAKAAALAVAIRSLVGEPESWEPEEQFAVALARDIAAMG